MGAGKGLWEKNPNVRLVAVEPEEAAILSGGKRILDHKIAGIGDGFIPEIVDVNLIDEVFSIKSDDAIQMARELPREQGMLVGISSGANVLASVQALDKIGRDKKLVTALPDRAERYFSTDLYLTSQDQVRYCSKHCKCPFQKL